MRLNRYLVVVMLAGCAPAGHIEWVKGFGDMPLYEAQAKCRYEVTAFTPATCQGVLGCAAESSRADNLVIQCMAAKGWNGVFVRDNVTPGTYPSNANFSQARIQDENLPAYQKCLKDEAILFVRQKAVGEKNALTLKSSPDGVAESIVVRCGYKEKYNGYSIEGDAKTVKSYIQNSPARAVRDK